MKHKERSFHNSLALCAVLIFLLALIFAGTDARLKTVTYEMRDGRIHNEVRLVMLSDLHRSVFGKEQSELISAVKAAAPHAVVLCGDIFDEHGEYEKAEPLLRALGQAYPCYYISGNHEYALSTSAEQRDAFTEMLSSCGIHRLESEKAELRVGNTVLDLFGIEDENRYLSCIAEDPARFREGNFTDDFRDLSSAVNKSRYSVLLCHRPLPEMVEESDFDLVLSGHCHGGQWRFPPFVNGLYAPNQGLFPRYAGGAYTLEGSTLIVGRGLSITGSVPRFLNRPEVVVVSLLPENGQDA